MKNSASGMSVTVGGTAFQDYAFFPLQLGLLCALGVTFLIVGHIVGVTGRNDRIIFALCAATLLLLVASIVVGPNEYRGVADTVRIETRRGVLLFIGAALAAVMVWGARRDVRVSDR